MKVEHARCERSAFLIVKGSLTIEFSREIAYLIAEVIHAQAGLKVDLSGVGEVDFYGSRLISVLHELMQGKSLEIVATSPIVDQALCGTWAAGLRNYGARTNEPASMRMP